MTHVCLGLRNMEKLVGIFQSGKLEHAGKVGKIKQNTGKIREFQTNAIYYYLLKLTKYSVRTTKRLKNTGKRRNQGILSIRKSGNHVPRLPINLGKLEKYQYTWRTWTNAGIL